MAVERFSSRREALGPVLTARLTGASRYLRIAGYFRSSLLEVVGEALETVGEIRVVCNGDLDPHDVKVARAARDGQAALARTLVSSWQATEDGLDLLLARERYRRLHEFLVSGRLKVRVVPRDTSNVFVHGKAGVIEHADGRVYSFVGSVNDSASGFRHAYEILWGDEDPGAATWVRDEFEHFWRQGMDLPDAVVKHVAAMAHRIEYRSIEDARDAEGGVPTESVLAERPIYKGGQILRSWQKRFVQTCVEDRRLHGSARFLIADDVGLGKTLSMAAAALVLSLLDDTRETVVLYQQLENERGRLLFEFGLLYLGFAVILILAAIWLGLWFAERLSTPVGRLVGASQRVGAGDLDVRVIEEEGDDEIAQLGRYFNQMTTQLKAQRDTLLDNTRQIERRRRLFDSVLGSVTSGVIGLDAAGRVAFANRSARRLLSESRLPEETPIGLVVPEFGPLFAALQAEGREVTQEQIDLLRNGKQAALLVRLAVRRNEEGTPEGYVVAFDDVTDLVSAQRMAAWGDVARRIAHEIKNPLTPIQLSAERIKRKFMPRLGDDGDALEQMTDVIVRQTNDLRRIVDEFSRFARMPEPQRQPEDLVAILRDCVTLQEAGQPSVHFVTDIPPGPLPASLDATMISQAFTNLIKNAGEAIETRIEKGVHDGFVPEIRIALRANPQAAVVTISDNGIGLPADRARLFEPYVTTREKGTGLGLPIVRKIIEEHGGNLALEDAAPFSDDGHRGAMAVVSLPLDSLSDVEAEREELSAS